MSVFSPAGLDCDHAGPLMPTTFAFDGHEQRLALPEQFAGLTLGGEQGRGDGGALVDHLDGPKNLTRL